MDNKIKSNNTLIKDFLNPNSMLTPGIAGSLTMMIANTLFITFTIPPKYSATILSFMLGTLVFASDSFNSKEKKIPPWLKIIYYIINSLIIFSVGIGANYAGMTTAKNLNTKNFHGDLFQSIAIAEEPPPIPRDLLEIMLGYDICGYCKNPNANRIDDNRIKLLENEIKNLEKDISSLSESNTLLNEKNKGLESDNESLKVEKEVLENDKLALTRETNALKSYENELRNDIQTTVTDIEELQVNLRNLKDKFSALSNKEKQLQLRITKKEEKILSIKFELTTLTNTINMLKKEIKLKNEQLNKINEGTKIKDKQKSKEFFNPWF